MSDSDVVGMALTKDDKWLFTVSRKGYLKRFCLEGLNEVANHFLEIGSYFVPFSAGGFTPISMTIV